MNLFGVGQERISVLAQGVVKATRMPANNPRNLKLQDAEAVYRPALQRG